MIRSRRIIIITSILCLCGTNAVPSHTVEIPINSSALAPSPRFGIVDPDTGVSSRENVSLRYATRLIAEVLASHGTVPSPELLREILLRHFGNNQTHNIHLDRLRREPGGYCLPFEGDRGVSELLRVVIPEKTPVKELTRSAPTRIGKIRVIREVDQHVRIKAEVSDLGEQSQRLISITPPAQRFYDSMVNVADVVKTDAGTKTVTEINQKIMIAFEDEWMPDKGNGRQALINAVTALSKHWGVAKDIVIVRSSRGRLAEDVAQKAREESVRYSNIVVLGGKTILERDEVLKYKDDSDMQAFLVGVDTDVILDATSLGKDTYMYFLEMLSMALRLAFIDKELKYVSAFGVTGNEIARRQWRFIPGVVLMEPQALILKHQTQTNFLRNA